MGEPPPGEPLLTLSGGAEDDIAGMARLVIEYDILTGQRQPGTPVLGVTPVTLGKIVVKAPSEC